MKKSQFIPQNDVPSVLRRHCQRSTSATVHPISGSHTFSGVFSDCDSSLITLDVQAPNPGRYSGTCSVFFFHNGTAYHFVTSILAQSTPSLAVLSMPTQITIERRSSLRVPIDAGLGVQLSTDNGRIVGVRPRNLSLTGMLVTFSPHKDPGLGIDELITLELRLAGDARSLGGRIRNQFRNNYGIAFSRVGADADSHLLAGLHHIYAMLRQQELSTNVMKTGHVRCAGTIVIPTA